MQHTASKISCFLFIHNSHVLDGMPGCHVLSQRLTDTLSERGREKREVGWSAEKWASFHLCHPHQTSASLQLFEASLIPAFRIKPVKKRMKSDRATEGDILGENGAPLKMCWEFFVCTDPQCSIWGETSFFFRSGGWLYRICMNRRRTLWSRGCKWNWSFFENPNWAPRDIVLALYVTGRESCFVTVSVIGSQRSRVIFCHRDHWHNPPFVESLCAVCIMAGWIDYW